MKLFLVLALTAALSGCVTKAGRCYPIIGFGWITVSTNQPSATMVKSTLLGAGILTLPPAAMIGFGQSRTILVTTNSNLILEQ